MGNMELIQCAVAWDLTDASSQGKKPGFSDCEGKGENDPQFYLSCRKGNRSKLDYQKLSFWESFI